MSSDTRVKRLVVTFAHGVLEIIRDDVLGAITRLEGEFEDVSIQDGGSVLSVPPASRKTRKPSSARPRGVYPQQLTHDPYCEWTGCTNAHRGPRNHFLCEEHKNGPPEEVAAFLQHKRSQPKKPR